MEVVPETGIEPVTRGFSIPFHLSKNNRLEKFALSNRVRTINGLEGNCQTLIKPPDPPKETPAKAATLAGANKTGNLAASNKNHSTTARYAATHSKLILARREFYLRGEWTPEAKLYQKQCGYDTLTALAHAGLVAVCMVSFFHSNTGPSIFEFDPEGTPSVVIEVLGEDGETVIDLASWPMHQPDQFATATREADMLGIINMRKRGSMPLRVHRTPHDWLASNCEGCVPVNEKWAGHWLNLAGGPFIADDQAHGLEIKAMLGRHASKHTILIPDSERKLAA